jgi:hypothetical protein
VKFNKDEGQSQIYITTDSIPPSSSSWRRAPWDSRPEFYFSQLNTCGYSTYIISSLTRGRVCHLHLLMALARAFILGSESRGTRDHILLSQIRDFPFCRLLRLAGLRWWYSTPPPHGNTKTRGIPLALNTSFLLRYLNKHKHLTFAIRPCPYNEHWTQWLILTEREYNRS